MNDGRRVKREGRGRAVRVVSVLTALLAVGVLARVSAQAPAGGGLERVGPAVAAHGYPAWYQDKTGVTLEFCAPATQEEVDGGWCLLLPADVPVVPELFPWSFADEHFYWAGDAGFDAGTISARLILGLEAAFAQGPVVSGDQVVFGRVRVRIDNLPAGRYRVETPYKTFEWDHAGGRLFETEDIGFSCPKGTFDCALTSSIGPFLLPSATAGGAELAPTVGPGGKLYIADPARLGPVTGSLIVNDNMPAGVTVNRQNWFRVIDLGTNTVIGQSLDFALMGRLFSGTIAGKVDIDRASYALPNKVEVFARAYPTKQARTPGTAQPPAITPVLEFFHAPCGPVDANGELTAPTVAATETQMFGKDDRYYGRGQLAAVPTHVCVIDETARNVNGQVKPTFTQKKLTDDITIGKAEWAAGVLTINAVSSAALPLYYNGQPFAAANATTVTMPVPPATVRVTSAIEGASELAVVTGELGTPPDAPLAVNDDAVVDEDGFVNIDVLANDTFTGDRSAVTIALPALPRFGTAEVVTVQVDGDPAVPFVRYRPSPNANGAEGIAYTIAVAGVESPRAYIGIQVNPVNDVPVAQGDSFTVTVGTKPLNVAANDSDVDLPADVLTPDPQAISGPGAATATVSGGVINFTTDVPGVYTFTYFLRDAAGAVSNTVTVTVTVASAEVLTITSAEFRSDKRRWRVSGTSNLLNGQIVTVTYANGTRVSGFSIAGTVIGTAPVNGAGTWDIDIVGVSGDLDPRTLVGATQVTATTPLGGTATRAFTIR